MNGTQQSVKVDKLLHTDETRWAARIKGHDKNALTIEVRNHPQSFYNAYSIHIITILGFCKRQRKSKKYFHHAAVKLSLQCTCFTSNQQNLLRLYHKIKNKIRIITKQTHFGGICFRCLGVELEKIGSIHKFSEFL